MDRGSVQRRQGERRRLWDRRSPIPRRSDHEHRAGERRVAEREVDPDRRARPERRGADRRGVPDRRGAADRRRSVRRRETPSHYTAEQLADLQARCASPGPISCPACDSRVGLDPAQRGSRESARGVLCAGCGRAAVVPRACACRVLVITQSAPLRSLLREMLASGGHDVVETDDTSVALAAYEAAPTDVIILDVVAPGRLSAPDFQRQLRVISPDPRIVALAGRISYEGADPLAVVQGLEATRSVRVPISREALLKAVDEARV